MNEKQKEILNNIRMKKSNHNDVIMGNKKRSKGSSSKSNSEAKVTSTVKKRDKGWKEKTTWKN